MQRPEFALAIHGGAGTLTRSTMTAGQETEYRAALHQAMVAGQACLAAGQGALDAVCAAVAMMEDSPLFNAGRGAVFTHEGRNEMDAAVMVGAGRDAGAVCQLTGIRNPVLAARAVMEKSNHVLLAGDGARAFAESVGLETAPAEYFHTDARYRQLLAVRDSSAAVLDHDGAHKLAFADKKFGTVGAVALDRNGKLAAATSTGGLTNKRWGRVGDSPVIGAGTWADPQVAISATGTGEVFLRACAAHEITARMRYLHEDAATAAAAVMAELGQMGGQGGLIVVDAEGRISLPFNTEGMYRGQLVAGGEIEVAIYRD
ncbi:isoaspartyl peptidase/L-asparaginase family protein [Crenobacter intestini]|uniref:Isoaspartyl peptidase n=1 Tax=Crenobacter intestini TaxID=2563443 RepID=A0A4T0V684_9NEIS|nr:isoaspartyl peptidase/L-asparaginase [Crenobacter intestini]TIC87192.1 isoaspartyl peptidase/L-asparaginase [Crenobacter intestini]